MDILCKSFYEKYLNVFDRTVFKIEQTYAEAASDLEIYSPLHLCTKVNVLKGCLHDSRLSYNPDRTHSAFEIIGVGLDLLHEFRLSYTTHSGLSFFIIQC